MYDTAQRHDLTQLICLIAVRSVHCGKVEQGRLLCRDHGAELTEEELYELAAQWRHNWQVDVPRSQRSRCFMCERALPPDEEDLCRYCFRKAEIGRFVNPITADTVSQLLKEYPPELIVETIQCEDCKHLSWITLGIIASRFRSQEARNQSPYYTSPHRCMPCYRKKVATHKAQTPSKKQSPLAAPVEDQVKGRRSLQELQAQVSKDAKPVAEG